MSMDDQAAVHEAIENHRYNPGKEGGRVLQRKKRERDREGEGGRERVFQSGHGGRGTGGRAGDSLRVKTHARRRREKNRERTKRDERELETDRDERERERAFLLKWLTRCCAAAAEILPNLEAYVDYQVSTPVPLPVPLPVPVPVPAPVPVYRNHSFRSKPQVCRTVQIQNSAYDFDANLAILKLYQFYPQTTNMEVVAKILAKALMAIPSTDFLLCTYLISEQIKVDAVVEALYNLSGLLEQAEFKAFWEAYPGSAAAPLLASIPDFEDKIGDVSARRLSARAPPPWFAPARVCCVQVWHVSDPAARAQFVIGLLKRSHQSLDKTVVATLLNKTLGECQQVVVEKGWKHDEHTVYFPLDDANQAKLSNTSGDKIEFSQLKTVLKSLAA